MLKKFTNSYDEREFRAARALIFCAMEGTEIADGQAALYRAYDMCADGRDDHLDMLVRVLEERAVDHAREYLENSTWAWDEAERHNVLLCLRHLRATGEVHPELAGDLHL